MICKQGSADLQSKPENNYDLQCVLIFDCLGNDLHNIVDEKGYLADRPCHDVNKFDFSSNRYAVFS